MSPTNAELFERAQRVIPGGVNSPVRAFGSVGGAPYFVARAEGAHVWDAEGTRRIDLVQSYGAIIAGHAHPVIVEAVQRAARDGTSYGAPTEREILLAEAICERVPSVEMVRLVSSGTEATMSAVRVARGHTGRRRVVKFAGNYHGHGDLLLAEAGSGLAALGLPGSAGVTEAAVADTVVAPYNVVPTLEDDTACVIVEPIAANMGLIAPQDGFLKGLRAECDRVGALLIFDEVITGFRVAYGGEQERNGLTPDLTTFGKVIGGGLNIGAYGGRADVMAQVAPLGPVYQAGTLSGNPLATAAGLAALSLLDRPAYATLTATAERLAAQLGAAFDGAELPAVVSQEASLVGLHLGPDVPTDYASAQRTDTGRYARFFHGLLGRGVALAPGAYEVMFPGLAHTDDIVDQIGAAAPAPPPPPTPPHGPPLGRGATGRRGRAHRMSPPTASSLGPLAGETHTVFEELMAADAVARLFTGDHTLWRDDPTELADRLGWIPVVGETLDDLATLAARADALVEGIDHVLLMGMGGSSLFPEVLARTYEPAPGRPRLHVLDTTDPAAIARLADALPPERTLHVASSKSGSTIETRSHLEWAWERAAGAGRFAAITDPGSELAELARQRGFADVFENRPDIGGRYSALSLFGIVPALLMGTDAEAILRGGLDGLARGGPEIAPGENPALALAAVLTAGVRAGRDKATFLLHPEVATLGLWLEQLLAESLGKDGTGVVPIVGEPTGFPDVYGDDRLFVVGHPEGPAMDALAEAGHPLFDVPSSPDPRRIGELAVTVELATALAGAALGVQPFDQPDVEAAKVATRDVLDLGDPAIEEVPLSEVLALVQPGDHLAIQAFVDPGSAAADDLDAARLALRQSHRVAVSLGYGPRFLHSTGQLHKGGPAAIVCLQVVGDDHLEIDIPGRGFGFGHLKRAQAAGDLLTLQARGIRAARVSMTELLT